MYNHIREFHKDQLLHVVNHYMTSEMRNHLMRECPAAYNSLCGRIVITSHVEDTGRKIIERPTDVNLSEFD
jgi:predicted oxidoreductase (fatty acid repression mutant protein)